MCCCAEVFCSIYVFFPSSYLMLSFHHLGFVFVVKGSATLRVKLFGQFDPAQCFWEHDSFHFILCKCPIHQFPKFQAAGLDKLFLALKANTQKIMYGFMQLATCSFKGFSDVYGSFWQWQLFFLLKILLSFTNNVMMVSVLVLSKFT